MHRISRSMHGHIEVNIENVWEELTKDLDSTWRRTQNDSLPKPEVQRFHTNMMLTSFDRFNFFFLILFFSQIYDRSHHRFSSLDLNSYRQQVHPSPCTTIERSNISSSIAERTRDVAKARFNKDKTSCREMLNLIQRDSFSGLRTRIVVSTRFVRRGRGNNWTVCRRKSCREIVCFLSSSILVN